MSAQERTEQATPKKLADARKRGQVPRSRELTSAAVTMTAAVGLLAFGSRIGDAAMKVFETTVRVDHPSLIQGQSPVIAMQSALVSALTALAPFFGIVVLAAVCAPALTGGWSFSLKAMAFKLEKLNPAKGLKRVFSARGLLELAKALGKFMLVGGVAVILLSNLAGDILHLGREPMLEAVGNAAGMGLRGLLILSVPLLLIAAIDVPFQLWDHARQLRMTRQEIKDEMKETDGNPEVKAKIRAMQHEQASRRMMEQVPTADVVVTNPTHFAVALRYDQDRMRAPRVVAKGADLVAARIRAVASEHQVPLLSAPPLARALFRSTELEQEIPAQLYSAVAQVLAWVYQLKHVRTHGGATPEPPTIAIDESLDSVPTEESLQ